MEKQNHFTNKTSLKNKYTTNKESSTYLCNICAVLQDCKQ